MHATPQYAVIMMSFMSPKKLSKIVFKFRSLVFRISSAGPKYCYKQHQNAPFIAVNFKILCLDMRNRKYFSSCICRYCQNASFGVLVLKALWPTTPGIAGSNLTKSFIFKKSLFYLMQLNSYSKMIK